MDFMADPLFNGQRLLFLTIAGHKKLCPAIGVGFSYKATDVISTLDEAIARHGCPKTIRVDNGLNLYPKSWTYGHGHMVLNLTSPDQGNQRIMLLYP